MKARFQSGLKPGQVLFVKHGFQTAGQSSEYIWVAVNRWAGSKGAGHVANEPHDVPNLGEGDLIELDEADIFDWMLQLSDDRLEGGYTEEVVRSHSLQ